MLTDLLTVDKVKIEVDHKVKTDRSFSVSEEVSLTVSGESVAVASSLRARETSQ